MKYISHKILQAGHIRIREMINNRIHGSVIAPNQPLEKYNDIIEADPNFDLYRTQENADAYEERLKPEPVSKEQMKQQVIATVRQIALDDVIADRIEADPYLSAIVKVEDDIEKGKTKNPSQEVRAEIANRRNNQKP